jgi:hypothetical protein
LIRYGVKADGTLAVPFMNYSNMTDDDLGAVVSYLRAQPPVRHEVPKHDLNPQGRRDSVSLLRPSVADAPPCQNHNPALSG